MNSIYGIGKSWPASLLCRVFKDNLVDRSLTNKWRLTKSEYQPEVFPDYCQGLAILMTRDLVPKIYEEAISRTPLWIDDVFLFGEAIKELNVDMISANYSGAGRQKMIKQIKNGGQHLFYHTSGMKNYYYVWESFTESQPRVCNYSLYYS